MAIDRQLLTLSRGSNPITGGAARRFENVIKDKPIAPEAYAEGLDQGTSDITAAVHAIVNDGFAVQGRPGASYLIGDGVQHQAGRDLLIDMSGCKVLRADGAGDTTPIISFAPSYSAATYADAWEVTAYALEPIETGNGIQSLPKLTSATAVAAGVVAGDLVKCLAPEIIPAWGSWSECRYAGWGVVERVSGNDIYLTLPFAEEGRFTPTRIVKVSKDQCLVQGGIWTEESQNYPVSRRAPITYTKMSCEFLMRDATFTDTAHSQYQDHSCFWAGGINNRYFRARYDDSLSPAIYGYARKSTGGGYLPFESKSLGREVRHIMDSGETSISAAELNGADPADFGPVTYMLQDGLFGRDCWNAGVGDHPTAYGTRVVGGDVEGIRRATNGATLLALQMRGRNYSVEGGRYRSTNPLRVAQATNEPGVFIGVTFEKISPNDNDAANEEGIKIDGQYSSGNDARVKFKNCIYRQDRGIKEMFIINDAVVDWDNSETIYNCTGGNRPVVATIGTNGVFRARNAIFNFDDLLAEGRNEPIIASFTNSSAKCFLLGRTEIDVGGMGGDVILGNFQNTDAEMKVEDLRINAGLFANNSGWRNKGASAVAWAVARRSDNGLPRNAFEVAFSSGATAIAASQWADGMADDDIHVHGQTNASGTSLGDIPAPLFDGQRLHLTNVGALHSLEINSTPSMINVNATRTLAVGQQTTLLGNSGVWNG